jgi:ADP-heptose:LPS heptosyltransferase
MANKNRNLFRLTRFILLRLPRLFRFFSKFRTAKKRLLVIKTDAIGDYVLFRNYLEVLRKSEKFRDYRITLLGHELWQELALAYDRDFVDDFLFISPDSLYDLPLKTFRIGWHIFKNNYAVVLQPSYTRLLITDGLAALSAANEIIGFESNNEGRLPKYKARTDKFYSRRLLLPEQCYFEFERSRFFFENVLEQEISLERPSLPVTKSFDKHIVIFPGAGNAKRSWEPEKFLQLIKLIRQQTPAPVYLAGGYGELPLGKYLAESLPMGAVIDLTGKTSLTQLVELIGSAALIIANETSAIHIAAAAKTRSICILGGGHFGRFAPYPENMDYAPVCLYEKMECFNCDWQCIYQTAWNEPFPCISVTGLHKVWQEVRAAL